MVAKLYRNYVSACDSIKWRKHAVRKGEGKGRVGFYFAATMRARWILNRDAFLWTGLGDLSLGGRPAIIAGSHRMADNACHTNMNGGIQNLFQLLTCSHIRRLLKNSRNSSSTKNLWKQLKILKIIVK